MRTRVFASLLLICFIIALLVRVYDITADLPAYFAGGSQDFTTDAAYLTLYAKSAVQYGTWDMFGYETWSAFKISLISGMSYVMFLLFGVSRVTSALSGTVLQMLGLIFIVVGLARYVNRQTLLLIAALLSTNYLLLLYGRVAFAENGLLFLAGLTFLVYSYTFETVWGKVAVGVLIALTALLGKTFGFLLAGGPLLYVIVKERQSFIKDALWLLIPAGLMTVLFSIMVHGEGGLLDFLYEHGVEQHGTPHGFVSPLGFFESLITFASTNIHDYTPVLSFMVYIALLLLLAGTLRPDGSEKALLFMIGWMFTWHLALAPFNYHPLRYIHVMIVPMAAIVAIVLNRLQSGAYALHRAWPWWRIVLLAMLNWYASFAIVKGLFYDTHDASVLSRVAWICLPVGLVLSAVILLIAKITRRKFSLSVTPVVTVVIAVLVAASDLWQFGYWMSLRTHMIDQAASDVTTVLGPGAVVGGQYGPVLAEAGLVQGFPLFVSVDITEMRSTLARYPVTHIAMASSSLTDQLQRSDLFQNAQVLTTMWLRDASVKLLRINHATGNAKAAQYDPSDYERGIALLYARRFAEADSVLTSFLRKHPQNKAALVELYHVKMYSEKTTEAKPIISRLYELYGTDYSVALMAAIFYRHVASTEKNQLASVKATECLEAAVRRGGENVDRIREMYQRYRPTDRVMR